MGAGGRHEKSFAAIPKSIVLLMRGVPRAKRRATVRALFEKVGLLGLEDRRPAQLSGGQQQREAVVRAIAAEPSLVLADEPTANLDTTTSEKIVDLMLELNRGHGVTFLLSTHDPRVTRHARRVVRLEDGQVASDGSARESLERP